MKSRFGYTLFIPKVFHTVGFLMGFEVGELLSIHYFQTA